MEIPWNLGWFRTSGPGIKFSKHSWTVIFPFNSAFGMLAVLADPHFGQAPQPLQSPLWCSSKSVAKSGRSCFTSSVSSGDFQTHSGFPLCHGWLHTATYIYIYQSHYDQVANNELSLCIFEFCLAVVSWQCALGPDALAGEAVMAFAALEALATNAWLSKAGDLVILRVSPWRARIRSSTVPCSEFHCIPSNSMKFQWIPVNSCEFHWTCCFFLF